MDLATVDAQLRQAAFDQVNLAAIRGGVLYASDVATGFQYGLSEWSNGDVLPKEPSGIDQEKDPCPVREPPRRRRVPRRAFSIL
jgi:hypothetical protein